MSKVWFVTGASRGFGREFVIAALERGDKVAATARNTDTLNDLVAKYGDAVLPIQLDVTDRDQALAAVKAAHENLGSLDVVINNAGYGLLRHSRGDHRAATAGPARDQPVRRVPRHPGRPPDHAGAGLGPHHPDLHHRWRRGFPVLGGYHASKWALEGLTESLAQEVGGFGIKVTLVEPGGFDTDWGGASATVAEAQPQYAPLHEGMAAQRAGYTSPKPVGFGSAILKVVEAEKAPLRVFFGEQPLQIASSMYQQRLDEWAAWASVSREAEGK